MIKKIYCRFSAIFSLFGAISPHILIGGRTNDARSTLHFHFHGESQTKYITPQSVIRP